MPWGKTTTTGTLKNTVGRINPLRYRGYYYDSDVGLYYLQSRYYDSEIGRFINADDFGMIAEGVYNLFSYCGNNPVNKVDSDGEFAISLSVLFIIGFCIFSICAIVLTNKNVQRSISGLVSRIDRYIRTRCEAVAVAVDIALSKAKHKPRNRKTEIHHIVAKKAKAADSARRVLRSVGISVEDPINKIAIRYNLHRHLHTKAYYKAVNKLLEKTRGSYEKTVKVMLFIRTTLNVAHRVTP